MNIDRDVENQLLNMYDEMQQQFLHTILVPAPEPMHVGHMVRVVDNQNPDWYRELCAKYPSNCKSHKNRFKPDTKIKRQSVIQFLLNPHKHKNFKYGNDLIEIAKQQLEQYKSEYIDNQYVPF